MPRRPRDPDRRRDQTLQLLSGDRAALLVAQPFLALLALRLEIMPVEDERLPTVATDGQHLFCDTDLMLRLDSLERRYLVLHSVWHLALLHPWRRGARARWAWDSAIDHEVNALLDPVFPVPRGSVWFEERIGQSAEQVYAWLLERPHRPNRGPLADLHLDGTATEQTAALETIDLESAAQLSPANRHDPAFAPALRQAGMALWSERVLGAAQQLRARGIPVPPVVEQLLAELRPPRTRWRQALAEFVSSTFGDRRGWLPPNRRFLHQGLYLPSRRSETLRLVLALDTSASTRALQGTFWSEIAGVIAAYDDYEVCLLQGDDQVRAVRIFSCQQPFDPEAIEVHGLGTTDFRPVFAWLERAAELPRALVFMTDGRGRAPAASPPYPVLWVLPDGCEPPARWGRVLKLPAPLL